jgi:serine/threonine protein kinase/tetratricopeptide (TPR) repeat protein
MIGKTISHYKILEKLGEGGMGVVYKAKDIKLKREVVLKFLRSNLTSDKEILERFEREAQSAAALNHPNIVTIYEIDQHEGQTFIAMEYVEGLTLRELIKKEPIVVTRVVEIVKQLCNGLDEAHNVGIVHRDIKPENILVDKSGRVKILDFGLARIRGVSKLTKKTSTLGTAKYMSPEQYRGKEVDHRTDIWSLGVLLYEMLTGTDPFQGDYEQAVMYAVLNEEPVSIVDFGSNVPGELCELTKRLLSKKAEDRPESCKNIRAALLKVNISASEETHKEKAIVVLPFMDMSPQKDQEYFCDGIAEEIINALTHVQDLRIIARTSAFSFKNKNMDVREIGRKLGVDFLLEGSVRKAGDQLRITVQLIDITDGSHVWSERYDRELTDVFSIQDEIAIKIMEKMKISLGKQERDLMTKRYTDNTEAYNIYLKGKYYWYQFSEYGYNKGIEYFEKAIDLDPQFAPAYASIADCYAFLAWYYYIDPAEAFTKAKEAASTALKMDDQLAEAHSVMALVKMVFDKDWQEAEKEFKRALTLNPGYSEAHIFYSIYLAARKRHEESIIEGKQGLRLDPVTFFPGVNLGVRYYYARQYDRALEAIQNALDLNPHVAIGRMYICFPLIMKGLYEEAYQNIQIAISQIGREQSEVIAMLGIIEFYRGNRDKAYEVFKELNTLAESGQVSCTFMGMFCTVLDKFDEAFRWLERGLEKHDHILIFMQVEPLLEKLHSDKRYPGLLKKIGLC